MTTPALVPFSSSPSAVALLGVRKMLHGASPDRAGAPATAGRLLLLQPDTATGLVGVQQLPVAVPGGSGAAWARRRVAALAKDQEATTDDDDDDDYEQAFHGAMDKVRENYGPILVGDERLLEDVSITANDSLNLVVKMIKGRPSTLSQIEYQEAVRVGAVFVELEVQCADGYVRADTVIAAGYGLATLVKTFGSTDDFNPCPWPVEKEDVVYYFLDLADSYRILCYEALSRLT